MNSKKAFTILCVLLNAYRVQAFAAFAHFMVGNTEQFTLQDWVINIGLAQGAHIDAFALNMAAGDPINSKALPLAFSAAASRGFQLFFSFDYAGNGPWDESTVISLIQQYGSTGQYWHRGSQPLVSTFEGPENAKDWINIKAQTGCFFIPDWSSLGAKMALEQADGVADGLFSWAPWPWGNQNMDTYVDASYIQYLGGKPYMMPVSPWFFTNLPGYNKNWLWRGDDLWYDRWQEVWYLQPEFIEIISWNDYGESHYIGPLDDKQYTAFDIGRAPFNYVLNMPHDGWRQHLPYLIDTYKNGIASITQESLVIWYRPSQVRSCATGGTTGNTASQLQLEFQPYDVEQDYIYIEALLGSPASLNIAIGSTSVDIGPDDWKHKPDGGVGIYFHNIPIDGRLGSMGVDIYRGSGTIVVGLHNNAPLTSTCANSVMNWNAWVTAGAIGLSPSVTPPRTLSQQVCVAGFGAGPFNGLCSFTCRYGYCPLGACVCSSMGGKNTLPPATNQPGFPANGDPNYDGLCSFACNLGYCPSERCVPTKQPVNIPTSSPFLPPACIAGTGPGNFAGHCGFACRYGFCPIHVCTCTATGTLAKTPSKTGVVGEPVSGDDAGLCAFACSHGYCPPGACTTNYMYRWPTNHNFIGLGDSYSAGIGAGPWVTDPTYDPDGKCLKGSGAYPYQMRDRGPELANTFVHHLGCTGAVIVDISNNNNEGRASQLSFVGKIARQVGWGTLSIGGNDVGFGKIAANCLLWAKSSCLQDIQEARSNILSPFTKLNLVNTYEDVLNVFGSNTQRLDFLLVVTGYIQFFNAAEAAPCDNQFLFRGHYLTQDLRNKINDLVVQMNMVIQEAVAEVNEHYSPFGQQIAYIDWDSLYDGKRFCEPGEDWKTNAWFLTIAGDDEDTDGSHFAPTPPPDEDAIDLYRYGQNCDTNNPDLGLQAICYYAKDLVNGATPSEDIGTALYPAWITKALHPKTAGHEAVSVAIYQWLVTL